jgi:hypothetical protein
MPWLSRVASLDCERRKRAAALDELERQQALSREGVTHLALFNFNGTPYQFQIGGELLSIRRHSAFNRSCTIAMPPTEFAKL